MTENFHQLIRCINKLKDTDKTKINEISILAQGFKADRKTCQQISEVIFSKISICESKLKLNYWYVMDSILKNICEPFNDFFSKDLIENFVETFKSCKDALTREKLHKLRSTWREKHFPYEITHELDRRIKTIDPNWPLHERKLPIDVENNIKLESNENRKRKSDHFSSEIPNDGETKKKILKPNNTEEQNSEIPIEVNKIENTEAEKKMWNPEEILLKLKSIPDLQNILVPLTNSSNSSPKETIFQEQPKPTSLIYDEYTSHKSYGNNEPEFKIEFTPNINVHDNQPVIKEQYTSNRNFNQNQAEFKDECISNRNFNQNQPAFKEEYTSNRHFNYNQSALKAEYTSNSNFNNNQPAFKDECISNRNFYNNQREYKDQYPPNRNFNSNQPVFREEYKSNRNFHNNQPVFKKDYNSNRNFQNNNNNNPQFHREPNFSNVQRYPTNNYGKVSPHVWSNQINGYPEMPIIGTDPRFLFRCPYIDSTLNPREIIDGCAYDVLLDRIQPCVSINGNIQAIRYVCSYITLRIDGISYKLSTNEVNTVVIRKKEVSLCIGGPYHQIIIDGWPYCVPMDGETYSIKIFDFEISICFEVKKPFRCILMRAIPHHILTWAEEGRFGHPKDIRMPPLNPLENNNLILNAPVIPPQPMNISVPIPSSVSQHPINPITNIAVPNYIPQHQINLNPNIPMIPFQMPQPANPQFINFPKIPVSCPFPILNQLPPILPTVNIPMTTPPPMIVDSNNNHLPVQKTNLDTLLNDLVSSGLISKSPEQSPKPVELSIKNYNPESFTKINFEVLESFSKYTQCPMCEIRFPDDKSEPYKTHLDYHYLKNSINLQSVRKCRSYYSGNKGFIPPTLSDNNDQETKEEKIVEKCQRFDEWHLNKCSVCNERFDDEWDDNEESYMLLNATILDGKVYHPICLEDIGKTFSVEEEMESDDKSVIENPSTDYCKTDPLLLLSQILNGNFPLKKESPNVS